MEFTTVNSTHDEIAEAIRGAHGKDVTKECSIVYLGQAIIGIAEDTEILERNVKCPHYSWINIGRDCYLAIVK